MIFSSPQFFFFFILFYAAFLFLKGYGRVWLIILGSAGFYSFWNPAMAYLPFLLIFVAYGGGRLSESLGMRGRVPTLLILASLCLPLLYFKYYPFINNTVCDIAGCPFLPGRTIPLGISFITFTLIAYVIDLHEGRYRPTTGLSGILGLTLFFPHLIAGPILRPGELIPQILRRAVSRRRLACLFPFGLSLFAIGFSKKQVIADPLAVMVDRIYSTPMEGLNGLAALMGMLGFTFQIYCDFSGYTDMALGCALILGIRLPTNFRSPYLSSSPRDFWRRWHITLSRWLRDYVYIRLGGNRCSTTRRNINVLATMALGGMWHGANWTFLIWGVYHGLGIVCSPAWDRLARSSFAGRAASIALTFIFVTIGWVFFRATSLSQALSFFGALKNLFSAPMQDLEHYAYPISLMIATLAVHRWDYIGAVRAIVARRNKVTVIVTALAAIMMAWLLSPNQTAKFIYFDF